MVLGIVGFLLKISWAYEIGIGMVLYNLYVHSILFTTRFQYRSKNLRDTQRIFKEYPDLYEDFEDIDDAGKDRIFDDVRLVRRNYDEDGDD